MAEGSPSGLCPRCGAGLQAGILGGVCPRCLLLRGLGEEEPEPEAWSEPMRGTSEEGSRRLGGYELLERLSQGSMGAVYRARHVSWERLVALKVLAEGALAGREVLLRFRAEAEAAARLDHPHIVPVYEVGEHEGCPYFTMKLLEGGTLAEHVQRFRATPRRAAELTVALAGAVHLCHQHGILHRDLKPANVLLDTEGNPYITDFGVACFLEEQTGLTQSGVAVGTPGYMAPEQAEGRSRHSTRATDVYGLGAILYELLTGRPPFEAETPVAILRKVLEKEPLRPRAIDPRIDKELEAICLNCLEKEPARRYGSAEELAQELGLYLKGEPLGKPAIPLWTRAWRWSLRHRILAGLLFAAVWLLLVTPVAALSVARAQERERQQEELSTNAFAARTVAGTVLFRLKQYSDAVARAAEQPEVAEALARDDKAALEHACKALREGRARPLGELELAGEPSPFDYWFILDTRGTAVARWPPPPIEFLARNFEFRDYFEGARRLAAQGRQTAYVARGIASEADGHYRLAVSAPIYDAQGTWLGSIVGEVDTGSALGWLRLNETNTTQRKAVLVTLRDRSRAEALEPRPEQYIVLLHDNLEPGSTMELGPETARQLTAVHRLLSQPGSMQLRVPAAGPPVFLEGYRDPLSDSLGPWLAAYAPVGYTGIGVIVQTPSDAAARLDKTLGVRLALWGGAPLLLGALLVSLWLWLSRR